MTWRRKQKENPGFVKRGTISTVNVKKKKKKRLEVYLYVSTCGDLDPVAMVTNYIILHDLSNAAEPDAMAPVFVDAITAELHPAVLFHCDSTSIIFKDAVCNESCQLTALQHSDSGAAVAVHEVCKNIHGLAALHIQADGCKKTKMLGD